WSWWSILLFRHHNERFSGPYNDRLGKVHPTAFTHGAVANRPNRSPVAAGSGLISFSPSISQSKQFSARRTPVAVASAQQSHELVGRSPAFALVTNGGD